jgi:hypothetical protein
MRSSEFVPPTVTYRDGPAGTEFILGVVPSLTPDNYDPVVSTEETERLQAETSRKVGMMETRVLEGLFYQESSQGEL